MTRVKQSVCRWGLVGVFSTLISIVFVPTQNQAAANKSGLDPQTYLPVVFVPPPFPAPSPSTVEALLKITPTGGINASTFNPGSFVITNSPNSAAQLERVVIDLRGAAFPDMVFDPLGVAGDVVAKDVTIDSDPAVVGFIGHSYSSPHDGGFDVLQLDFNDFEPGEQIAFSVDIDPTSIQGAPVPGPSESGSVSGLELSGAFVIATFTDSLIVDATILPIPGSNSGATALLRENRPSAPTVSIDNVPTTPSMVSEADQVVQISGGPDWSTAVVTVIEGGLFTAGLPNGGFDIDPFEANSAILVNEYRMLVDYEGSATIPITLTRSNNQGGLNHILVYFEDYYGYPGINSPPVILELAP